MRIRMLLVMMLFAVTLIAVFSVQSCSMYDEQKSEEIARDFVRKCPTFQYDGVEKTLMLLNKEKLPEANSWRFTYSFQSRHAGYGDRTDKVVAQVITPHQAEIIVKQNMVTSAMMDGRWNILTQRMVNGE